MSTDNSYDHRRRELRARQRSRVRKREGSEQRSEAHPGAAAWQGPAVGQRHPQATPSQDELVTAATAA